MTAGPATHSACDRQGERLSSEEVHSTLDGLNVVRCENPHQCTCETSRSPALRKDGETEVSARTSTGQLDRGRGLRKVCKMHSERGFRYGPRSGRTYVYLPEPTIALSGRTCLFRERERTQGLCQGGPTGGRARIEFLERSGRGGVQDFPCCTAGVYVCVCVRRPSSANKRTKGSHPAGRDSSKVCLRTVKRVRALKGTPRLNSSGRNTVCSKSWLFPRDPL